MEIYQPKEDSYLLQEQVKKHAFGRVLDLGTGSGIQAITAAENKKVREVVAVDINKNAVKQLKHQTEKSLIKKIMVKESDLFSNINDKYDTIIFNPPYLPQDKGVEDVALYGGKHGWELSAQFFSQVNKYLTSNGKILFLFSSLTDKNKVEELIEQNLLEHEELSREKLPMFEELYVYLIKKSKVLQELEHKNISKIEYFTHGKRGNIYVGELDKSKFVKSHLAKKDIVRVAIKVKRKQSEAVERMKNEARWLKVLNKEGIGPRLLFHGPDYLVYKFVEGKFILEFVKNSEKKMIREVLIEVLNQCFVLDKLGVNKEEMHHPHKHIIVNEKREVTLLDFERCYKTDKPKNVTQFVEFICRQKELEVNIKQLRTLAQKYKKSLNQDDFKKIIHAIG